MNYYEEIAERCLAKASIKTVATKKAHKQLPLWPEADRAAPCGVLRSALFRVTSKKFLGETSLRRPIASWPGWSVSYTGLPLSQSDFDVWLEILHIVSRDGNVIYTTTRGLLKGLGRARGTKDVKWLLNSLARLNSAGVEITMEGEATYMGTLIDDLIVPANQTRVAEIRINPKLANLFEDGYTLFDWETRKQLKGDLTKWLYGYIHSHRATPQAPSKIGFEKLVLLCGSARKETRFFRHDVRKSMAQLEGVGVVTAWSVDNDVLSFSRPSQRVLTKSSSKKRPLPRN